MPWKFRPARLAAMRSRALAPIWRYSGRSARRSCRADRSRARRLLLVTVGARSNNLGPGIFLGGLLRLPGLDLLEQCVAVGFRARALAGLRVSLHELVELVARDRLDVVLVEP